MVGNLKCTVKAVYIKSFEAKRGVRANPLEPTQTPPPPPLPSPAYGPEDVYRDGMPKNMQTRRDGRKMKVNVQSPTLHLFSHYRVHCSEKDIGIGLCTLTFIIPPCLHTFGMPSQHLFTFAWSGSPPQCLTLH